MHDRVAGSTPAGKAYRANDPELLNWVQATAAYGFLQAYHANVRPLSDLERDRYYAEGTLAASLYGASAPTSEAALEMRFEAMSNRLERSDILFEFLAIMRSAPILPLPLRPVQPLLVRAAVAVIPHWLQTIMGLTDHGLHAWEAGAVRQIGAFADRLVLETNPAVQASRRMRLPANYLYVHGNVCVGRRVDGPPNTGGVEGDTNLRYSRSVATVAAAVPTATRTSGCLSIEDVKRRRAVRVASTAFPTRVELTAALATEHRAVGLRSQNAATRRPGGILPAPKKLPNAGIPAGRKAEPNLLGSIRIWTMRSDRVFRRRSSATTAALTRHPSRRSSGDPNIRRALLRSPCVDCRG
jgi:ER-bound oxygenase mpaB/B'/Rubber oxygenase, catalytic domain